MQRANEAVGVAATAQLQIFSVLVHPSNRNPMHSKITSFSNNIPYSETVLELQDSLSKNANQHSNFIYVYFWFAYHLLLSPFRLKKRSNRKYEIHRWFPQQVLCGVTIALTILRLFTSARDTLENIRMNDPVSFFNMFCEISSFIFKVIMLAGFWRKGKVFVTLANYVSSYDFIPYNPYKMESIKTLSLLCSSYSIFAFLRFITGSGFFRIQDWSTSWWYRRTVADARYAFFLANATNFSTAPEMYQITPIDTFLAIIQALSVLSRYLAGLFVDLCILMHVWVLWVPSTAFTNTMDKQVLIIRDADDGSEKCQLFKGNFEVGIQDEINSSIRQFEALKRLSNLIGYAIGDSLLPYIAEALFFYALYFDDILLTSDIVERLVLSLFYFAAICILLFSAEITRKMRWFKSWLCEDGRINLIDPNKVGVLFDDFANHSVGITASGIFTINYGFVGTIVSVLITYFIIRLQSPTTGPEVN